MGAERIPVGYILRAHGIRGDVLVVPLSDNPRRFVAGAELIVEGREAAVTVTAVRRHNEGLILSLAESHDRDHAEALRKSRLMIEAADRRPLEPDEFWPDQLIGLTAATESGDVLGQVTDVVLGAAQDRLVVTTPAGRAVEVPFVAALVDAPVGGTVVMRPPVGLFDGE